MFNPSTSKYFSSVEWGRRSGCGDLTITDSKEVMLSWPKSESKLCRMSPKFIIKSSDMKTRYRFNTSEISNFKSRRGVFMENLTLVRTVGYYLQNEGDTRLQWVFSWTPRIIKAAGRYRCTKSTHPGHRLEFYISTNSFYQISTGSHLRAWPQGPFRLEVMAKYVFILKKFSTFGKILYPV